MLVNRLNDRSLLEKVAEKNNKIGSFKPKTSILRENKQHYCRYIQWFRTHIQDKIL